MVDQSSLLVREALWPADKKHLRELRAQVFVEEQHVPADIEWDGRDAEARHIIAQNHTRIVGCGRLLPDGRIGRLAVRKDLRGTGIGAQILDALLGLSQEHALPRVYLHAQSDAIAFYERAGFVATGSPFNEAGIAHLDMRLSLDYRNYPKALSAVGLPQPFDQLATAQASSARRDLAFLSPKLDPRIFATADLLKAIGAFLRSSAANRLRILVEDPESLIKRSHALLRLARRLPSRIQLRSLREHPQWRGETMLLRDRDGVLAHPAREAKTGFYRPDDRPGCEAALQRYEVLWNAGRADPEFQVLSL